MSPKAVKSDGAGGAKKRNVISIEKKKKIIDKYESGVRVSLLVKEFDLPKSSINSILRNREAIKGANVAKGVVQLTRHRSDILEKVENLLVLWIGDKQRKGDSVSEDMICARARQLYGELQVQEPGTSSDATDFVASRGWFDRFKRRTGIHNVTRHGEAASSDKAAADSFVVEFAELVRGEGYLPQQIFNCDETGLFWKRMPNRTYITAEEKALPGHKPMKDRLTVMLCANASGDCRIKPLVIYHSETPRAFKKNKVQKHRLPVMWRSNPKAWATRQLCREWLGEAFAPQAKQYLEENGLPLKCLLLMDNAPAHPVGMEDDLDDELQFIKIKFLPPNTTAMIQPMDQLVISNFKKIYTRELFARCFQATTDTDLSLREFWRSHYNILHCINLINKSWQGVSIRTLQAAWKKLWPSLKRERDFEGFEPAGPSVVEEIVSLGKRLGLELVGEDVEELVEAHHEDLTTEELVELHKEQQESANEDLEREREEDPREDSITTVQVRDMCRKWAELQDFVEMHHPNKALTATHLNSFNDHIMAHFRSILHKRKRQLTLDRFLVPKADEQEGESSQPAGKKGRTSEGEPPSEGGQ